MPDDPEMEVFYRFCGQHVPHGSHIFWRDFGVLAGGRHYDCLGWMTWQQ